ncbi:uncharacterized protein BKA78DRAFT_324879 [Phyllosticta capitalensis]|uniref:uncharacterized protein n=1 Tax=Phyllosticta capitalensis TaxID=121624 RepID=UPI0031312382
MWARAGLIGQWPTGMPRETPAESQLWTDLKPEYPHVPPSSSAVGGTFPLEEFAKRDLQITNRGTDITIRSRERTFHVHSILLCSKSAFFNKACDPDSPFRRTFHFNFDDEDPIAVWLMLSHCYGHGSLGTLKSPKKRPGNPCLMMIEERLRRTVIGYAIADKYLLPEMKESMALLFEKLERSIFRRLDRSDLIRRRYQDIDQLMATRGRIIKHVFEVTSPHDRRLRKLVLGRTFKQSVGLMRWQSFREKVEGIDGFEAELDRFVREDAGARPRRCPNCKWECVTDMMEKLRCEKPFPCPRCKEKHLVEEWNKKFDDALYGRLDVRKEDLCLRTSE